MTQVCVQYKAAKKACPKPGSAERKQLQQSFVAQLVQQAEFDEAGKQLKVTVKQSEIDTNLQKLELQYAKGADGKVDDAKWKKVLTDNHTSRPRVVENLRNGLLRQAIYVESDQERDRRRRGRQGVLREEQEDLRDAREPPDPPHPGQEQGAGRQDLRAARQATTRSSRRSPRSTRSIPARRRPEGKLGSIQKGQTVPAFDKVAFSRRDRQGRPARQELLRLARDRGHGRLPSRRRRSRSTRR